MSDLQDPANLASGSWSWQTFWCLEFTKPGLCMNVMCFRYAHSFLVNLRGPLLKGVDGSANQNRAYYRSAKPGRVCTGSVMLGISW